MSDEEYRDYVFAARVIKQANARLGNPERCSWTADDMYDLASSVAAEAGTEGKCPMCNATVFATDSARVRGHINSKGQKCTASGQWFHIAAVES